MILEAMGQAAQFFGQADFLLNLALGSLIGVVFGVIPGLHGLLAMALILPFAYKMNMYLALSFMMAAYASAHTGGSLTAILLGIPGTPGNTATILDGYPMARKGQGGKAISIAIWASIFGGLLGSIYFAALVPVAYQVGLFFEAPEIFMTVILALVFLSMAGEGNTLSKGIIGGLIGMMLGFVGFQNLTAVARFTFGIPYLIPGMAIVPLALGIFGIPELYELMVTTEQTEASCMVNLTLQDTFYGLKKIAQNLKVFLVSSVLGTLVGIIPGVGGETSTFVCYSYAKTSSGNPDEFGKGAELGVLAPETSNNAKEGGSLLPTLGFGIPGSAAMAILLGGLLVVGLQPGPHFLRDNADIAFLLAYACAFSNILGGLLILVACRPICSLVSSPINVLAPALGITLSLGVYLTQSNIWDVGFMFLAGFLGYYMKKYGFSRAALLVAFVLTNTAEMQFDIVYRAYGAKVFSRPAFDILIILTLGILVWSYIKAVKGKVKPERTFRGENILYGVAILVSLYFFAEAWMLSKGDLDQLFPIVISIATILLAGRQLYRNFTEKKHAGNDVGWEDTPNVVQKKRETLLQLAALVVLLYFFGLGIGGLLFSVYFSRQRGGSWRMSLILGCALGILGHFIPVVLGYMPYRGLILSSIL